MFQIKGRSEIGKRLDKITKDNIVFTKHSYNGNNNERSYWMDIV